MSLWNLKEKASAIVVRLLHEKIPNHYRERLSELGFHPKETVSCLRQTFAGGPRLYRVGNCVYALEREIADAIEVDEQEASEQLG